MYYQLLCKDRKEKAYFRNFEEADVQTFSDIFPADLYRQGVLEYLKTED